MLKTYTPINNLNGKKNNGQALTKESTIAWASQRVDTQQSILDTLNPLTNIPSTKV